MPAFAPLPFALLLGCPPRPLPDLEDAHRDLSSALPVFPGAEGFGTDTPAGRGGAILHVTNLDDTGSGSLRDALSVSGPRVVVFDVAGTIWLTEGLLVEEPFLTVAGQTAPSPGVTLAGAGLTIRTHDVLVQHLRIRPGDRPDGPNPEDRDALRITGAEDGDTEVYGIVVDHCSLSWATDENASTWYAGVHDVTWSGNLVAEGLWYSIHPEQPHSMGLLLGDHTRRASVIGNAFAHNNQRHPYVKFDVSALVANNLIYDPGELAIHVGRGRGFAPSLVTVLGNAMIRGDSTGESTVTLLVSKTTNRRTRVFEEDNGEVLFEREGLRVDEPPVTVEPLAILAASELEEALLDRVGARPADRDAVDLRIVDEIRTRTGGAIDSIDDVGGWPDLAEVHQVADVPADPSGDDDGDGYTNVEEWLHALAAGLEQAGR